MRKRIWTKEDLIKTVKESSSIRQIIQKLGLIPAGGNYSQIQKYLKEYGISTSHLKGKVWNKGLTGIGVYRTALKDVLKKGSFYQSYKLKNRLFKEGLKNPLCEECGWAKKAEDGRIPLELDHINGDHYDNRLGNLRVLCPNCHSLTDGHRGRKK